MQSNSGVIQDLGILAQLVYQDKYFRPISPDVDIDNADHSLLKSAYSVLETQDTVAATSDNDADFQAFLLKNNATQEYVIAFRGTEDIFNPFSLEHWKDGWATDILMAIGDDMVAQLELALLFIKELSEDADYNLMQTNTTLTGHSLGGSLASIAGYTYGFDTYTYNGFGVRDILDGSDYTNFVDANNITSLRNESAVTNILHVGGEYVDIVTGGATNIMGQGHVGELLMVKDHTGGYLDIMGDHRSAVLNESIAIYNNILSLFPDEDYNSLTEVVGLITAGDEQVDRFLATLTELTNIASNTDHVVWSETLAQSGTTNLTLNGLGEKDIAALEILTGSMSEMYALLYLNPFVIEGVNYSHLNVEGCLDAENYSEKFIEDRAAFLYYSMPDNTKPDSIRYEQRGENGADGFEIPDNQQSSSPSNYIFGTKEHDAIMGDQNEDHLYGMGSNDVEGGNWRKAA